MPQIGTNPVVLHDVPVGATAVACGCASEIDSASGGEGQDAARRLMAAGMASRKLSPANWAVNPLFDRQFLPSDLSAASTISKVRCPNCMLQS